jgi:DNA-directed RNA polymerase specialized sigma24 family protein
LERTRREGIDRRIVVDDSTTSLAGEDADNVEHWELAEWLDEGLLLVGKPCRDLLSALYLDPEQPSYAEVAERLGMAIGSVGPTRIRCLERMRRVLGE